MVHIAAMREIEDLFSHPMAHLLLRRSTQFRLTAVLCQLLSHSIPFHHLLSHMDEPAVILRLSEGSADQL